MAPAHTLESEIMRATILAVCSALVFCAHYSIRAQDAFPAGPNHFSFIGNWDCKGQFINGKTHHSHYTVQTVLGGAWLQLSESDIEPHGYLSEYLVRFDPAQKLYIEEDINNFGYARYTSPGWQQDRLVFTGIDAHYAQPLPENRFVYTVTGPNTFDVSWESRRDSNSAFRSSDLIHCTR